jgi:glycosyltransferase involved in cell wall biosynthesis
MIDPDVQLSRAEPQADARPSQFESSGRVAPRTDRAAVDVLMTAYNSAATIRESLLSILNQTFTDVRIVVVNDGSSDETGAILAQLAAQHPQIEVITQVNAGIVAAANKGLAHCTADLVARLDSDDIAFAERIARQVEFLKANHDCVAVSCLVHHIDVHGRRLGSVAGKMPHAGVDQSSIPSREPYIMHPFVMMRRAALVRIGGYRHVDFAEDTDLYWRLREIGRLEVMEEFFGEYRVHQSSVSSRSIVNGRISALNSQLSAISAQRRRDGVTDLEFGPEDVTHWRRCERFSEMLRTAALALTEAEGRYLQFAAAAKLLELNSYRPYELERSDCVAIRYILRQHRAEIVGRLPDVRRHWGIACARLLRKGLLSRAAALYDWCIVTQALKSFFIQVGARLLPLAARRMYRQVRSRAAA